MYAQLASTCPFRCPGKCRCPVLSAEAPTHVDCRNCRWDSGVTGVENNCFDLALIQQQLVARYPTLDVGGACFDSASSNICVTGLVSREVNIKLSVVGIHMVFQVVSSEYGNEWHTVPGVKWCV